MITFLVPTVNRPSLMATLRSIETWPGDEILVVGKDVSRSLEMLRWHRPEITLLNCDRGNDWGHSERNFATRFAKGRYIAHIDDDDVYLPGTRALMSDAIDKHGGPTLFRMQFPNGITLWRDPKIYCGNIGTPCFLIPNQSSMMGEWGSFVGGDCHFLETSKWQAQDYQW